MSESINPLLQGNKLPGSKFQLPSQGLMYTNGELDPEVENGELHVYPMTAYDEILIKSPDLLLSGEAIEAVFKKCIPQVKHPLRLFSADVDFLTICLRSVSFGNEVHVNHIHTCEEAKDHEYVISIDDFIARTKMIDPTTLLNQYRLSLSDKVIHFNPIRYDSMIKMLQIDVNEKIDIDVMHDRMARQMADLINCVDIITGDSKNPVTDIELIVEWIKNLTVKEVKEINNAINNMADWGTDMSYELQCKDCNHPMKVQVPLNPMHFFM